MARREINIGVEGNDGTGDSIRESFRKTNENFQELYAVFGVGGQIRFTSLSDTPNTLIPNTLPVVNGQGNAIDLAVLGSNSDLDENEQDTITFNYSQAGKIIISTAFTKVADDLSPSLGGPMFAANQPIAGVTITAAAAEAVNNAHDGISPVTIDDLVITKGYADRRYANSGLPLRVAAEPGNVTDYTRTIEAYENGNVRITDHGFESGSNGSKYKFNAELVDPTNITSDNDYFIRYVSDDLISLHPTREDAINDDPNSRVKINVVGVIENQDVHTLTDSGYDATLSGNFLSDVAMPRDSVTRRQGDTMEGALYLSDHPGDLAGSGTPNGIEDLQAASKYYVDNTSYSSPENLFVSTSGDDTMKSVPIGKEGTSLTYAFKTINAAARRAEEIIATAPPEAGPYFQTITKEQGASPATVVQSAVETTDYPTTFSLLQDNKDYIAAEVIGYINKTFPDFAYNQATCLRDTKLIIDSISYDIVRGLNTNFLSQQAGYRYYSSVSGRIAIGPQLDETVAALEFARDLTKEILENDLYQQRNIGNITSDNPASLQTPLGETHGLSDGDLILIKDAQGMLEINDRLLYVKVRDDRTVDLFEDADLQNTFDTSDESQFTPYTNGGIIGLRFQDDKTQTTDSQNADPLAVSAITGNTGLYNEIITIIRDGIDDASDVRFGSPIFVEVDNGSRNYVDQNAPDNTDILPGKVIIGKRSGAIGRITSVARNQSSGSFTGGDVIKVNPLKPIFFEAGEELQYGNFVKTKQISIFVESGIYEEDFPIKLPANVSLKGDEFRRVIIRPKDRVSQSKYANIYFYRDKEFDGLQLATGGTPFQNQAGVEQGFLGYHYLKYPDRPTSVFPNDDKPTNVGGFTNAATILKRNSTFIQEEIEYFIDDNFGNFTYDETKCRRDSDLILTAVGYDLALGTNYNSVTAGLAYQRASSAYLQNNQLAATVGAITYLKNETVDVVEAATSNTTASTRTTGAFNEILDILQNGQLSTDLSADALVFPAPIGVNQDLIDAKNQLQANRGFLQAETLAFIGDQFPELQFDSTKCSRDVGYIVDALSYDILYGGTSASTEVADSYFEGAVAQLAPGQDTATVSAYNHLKTVVSDVVQGITVTPTTGNSVSQDTSYSNATSAEATTLGNLLDLTIDVINDGGTQNLPSATYPSLSWVDVDYTTARTAIENNRTTLIDDTITYIDDTFVNFTYNRTKCKRDVGLIVDAIAADLIAGGVENTLTAQGEYYVGALPVDGSQNAATSAAIGHISTLASSLLIGASPGVNQIDASPDLSRGTGETGSVALVGELVDVVTYAFNSQYNPPKRNDEMDMFLMNDATIIRNVTCQGHGGFMEVLDPEGQILTKSPYTQTASSFSLSSNSKRFAGGMFVDAFVGNIPCTITAIPEAGNFFKLSAASDAGQGLFIRPPQLPCPFYLEGRRFQVNAIENYDSGSGIVTLLLDSSSNDGQGYDPSTFDDPTTQRDIFLQTAGNRSLLANDFTQINDLGYGLVCTNGAFSEQVSTFTYYNQVAMYANNGSEIRALNCSNGYGFFGLVAEGADPNEIPDQVVLRDPMVQPGKAYTTVANPNALDQAFIHVTDLKVPPTTNSLITIDHGGSIGRLNYIVTAVTNLSDTDNDGALGDSGNDVVATGGVYSNAVYKLDFRADNALADDFFGVLQDPVPDGTLIEYRHNFAHTFAGVNDPDELETRPSTAINFDESDDTTYRSIAFSTNDSLSQPLGNGEVLTTFEIGFDFISLAIDTTNLTGNGSAQGDTTVAIQNPPGDGDLTRLTRDVAGRQPGDPGYSGGMLFVWAGKTHQIVDYTANGTDRGVITITDYAGFDISGYGGTGLAAAIPATDTTLSAGLPANATAEITIAISLLRATGHDFTEIGTGGYNTSNYPNVLLGEPTESKADAYTDAVNATKAQVWERRKGRVFFVTTDQDGFFRVGKFFSVDQSTGDITFAGEIGLSNANSLGFKKGVTINEFSSDDGFADDSGEAVPTEKAVQTYVNRRLGVNRAGTLQIQGNLSGGNRIGPGAMMLNGISAMEGDMDMGTNQITNMGDPGSDLTAATNKQYVDDKVTAYDDLGDLRSSEFNNVTADDILVATGKRKITLVQVNGLFTVGSIISGDDSGASGTIVDIETKFDEVQNQNVTEITYTPGSLPSDFNSNDTISQSPTITGAALEDPTDEFANASQATTSDITFTVARSENGTEFDMQFNNAPILNADVNASAAIAQSKLNMQDADTFDESDGTNGWAKTNKVQSDLGLAKFSDENFETDSGFVRIKANGIVLDELQQIATDTVIGRSADGTGNTSQVPFSTVVSQGNGLEDGDFVTTLGDVTNDGNALTQIAAGDYRVTAIDTAGSNNSIAKRLNDGKLRASGYVIGGADSNVILDETNGVLTFSTPAGGTILTASGTGPTNPGPGAPTLEIPGIVDIGSVGGSGGYSQGTLQGNSTLNNNSLLAVDWTYTKVIEDTANTATISLGAGTGLTGNAVNTIVLSTNGDNPRVLINNSSTTFSVPVTIDGQNNLSVGGDLGVTGASTLSGNVNAAGNLNVANDSSFGYDGAVNSTITFGSGTGDRITFNALVESNIEPDDTANNRNIGSATRTWNTVYATTFEGTATQAQYADLAENYLGDAEYEPGTVLVFGGEQELTITNTKGDHRVAGIVTTNPAHLMNSTLEGEYVVGLALQGRVPCKVLGTVKKGDMLVTSAVPGYAIVDNNPKIGTVIGKAVENKTDDGKGIVEVVTGRV